MKLYTSILHSYLGIVLGTWILIIAIKHFEDYAIEQIQIIKISSSRHTEMERDAKRKQIPYVALKNQNAYILYLIEISPTKIQYNGLQLGGSWGSRALPFSANEQKCPFCSALSISKRSFP